MKEKAYTVSGIISAAVAYVSGKFGILVPLMMLLIVMMVIDYITGMVAAMTEAVEHPGDPTLGWSSKKGFAGIVKKVAIFAVITVAIALDYLIAVAAQQLGMAPPQMAIFGLLIVVWFLLNEMLSIVENAGRIGAPVPDWLAKYIAVLKDKIDEQGGGSADTVDGGTIHG